VRSTTHALTARRLSQSEWSALAPGKPLVLGALGYGTPVRRGGLPASVRGALLDGSAAAIDVWCSVEERCRTGQSGSVRWRHDGHWLFGALELDEAQGEDLTALAERAYGDVFAALEASGCPHLLRLWNALPGINADASGLERYRRFNAGRQQAFLAARRAAFEGAPAASALGIGKGPFSVRFLAGRTRPVAIENPRQVSAYHYPRDYGPKSPTFSRAALVEAGAGQVALLISGTASIVGHASVHAGDVEAQAHETLANLFAVIGAAHARTSARFELPSMDLTVYLRRPAHAPLVRRLLGVALGARSTALRSAVYLQADICRSELLVEIEAHGFARGTVG